MFFSVKLSYYKICASVMVQCNFATRYIYFMLVYLYSTSVVELA